MFDHSGKQIYLICGSTDMRNGTDGLSAIEGPRGVRPTHLTGQ